MKKFEDDKEYIFDRDTHIQNCGNEWGWALIADQKKVKVLSEYEGAAGVFLVLPKWCKEI
jgi:hypothetical protein